MSHLTSELTAHRTPLALLFAFCMSATFAFLAAAGMPKTAATAVTGFNPGNIINDATMANYTSMTVADIQAFLTAKNPCTNTDYDAYLYYTNRYPNLSWHWEGEPANGQGHFVCLSEERFSDGVAIGTGDTAAEIIYAAAQEYRINPQVLLVLLEKEQSLITDTFPHINQYRSATGYGCPDTAACDSRYYGFKNQIFRAAELFRYTLDHGSVLYPEQRAGIYVAYHPNSSCGGSEVYIENRATAALYRYTPYQPNAAALAAGTGTGNSCSAYGNRNFYIYFTRWFGSTQTEPFESMAVARIAEIPDGTNIVNTTDGSVTTATSRYLYFTAKTTFGGELCLADDTLKAADSCIYYRDLIDYPTVAADALTAVSVPRFFSVSTSSRRLDLTRGTTSTSSTIALRYFTRRLDLGSTLCLLEDSGTDCYLYDTITEISAVDLTAPVAMDVPRTLFFAAGTQGIDLTSGRAVALTGADLDSTELDATDAAPTELVFSAKTYLDGQLCLGTDDLLGSNPWCVPYSALTEYPAAAVSSMAISRYLYVPAGFFYRDAVTGIPGTTTAESALYFGGRSTIDDELCLIPDAAFSTGQNPCYPYYEGLAEVGTFVRMDIARDLEVAEQAPYVSAHWLTLDELAPAGRHHFTQKTYLDGQLCLADDDEAAAGKCILYANLTEL